MITNTQAYFEALVGAPLGATQRKQLLALLHINYRHLSKLLSGEQAISERMEHQVAVLMQLRTVHKHYGLPCAPEDLIKAIQHRKAALSATYAPGQ